MAAHKNFIITYIFPDRDSVEIPIKAPKYPSDKAMARAVAKAGLELPTGQGQGLIMREWTAEIGLGKAPLTKVSWYPVGNPTGRAETYLYSYVIEEIT